MAEEPNQILFHKINPNEELQIQSSIDDHSSDSALSSSSSTDLTEDASSSSSSSYSSSSSSNLSSSNANSGPLYELSEIMAQLPIKRGLSKFYQGKSQSYTSLASVKSVEDLAKKVNNHHKFRSKMKSCKSFAGLAFDGHKLYSPKATISKKASRASFSSSFK